MTAKPRRQTSQAPMGRNKPAQGNALGNAAPRDQSPEGAAQSSDWPVVPLGELAADERNAITDGPFGSKLKTDHYTDSGPRVIRLKNIGDTEFVDAKAHISEGHFATLQKHRVFPGDVVIAALGEDPPRSCLVPEHLGPAIVKADCIRFKAGPRILPKFINYVLNAPDLRRYAKSIVHGVGRPRLNLGEIKGLPIPVPPLDDQRRIVAEIEKQFTRLEAGVAALRRVQANLKRYRAAVLKAACEGRLVPTEAELHLSGSGVPPLDPTSTAKPASSKAGSKVSAIPKRQDAASTSPFESGKQLLARILTERRQNWQGRGKYKEPASPSASGYEPDAPPEGWTWATVSEVSAVIVDCPHSTAKFVSEGHPCLDTTCMKPGRVVREKLRYVTKATFDERIERLVPEANDIVFAREGTVGTAVAIPADLRPCLGQRVMLMRPDACILPAYFQHCLNSETVRRQYLPKIVGSTAPHINVAEVKMLAIPLPPLAEQTRIVEEVERRLSVVEELEAVVTTNLQRATRLRQAILQKAFTGELL